MFKHNSSMFPHFLFLPPPSPSGFVQGGTKSWRSSRSIAWIVDCTPRRPAVERPCRSRSTENYLSCRRCWSFDRLIDWFDLIVWSFDWLIDWFDLIWFDWLVVDWLIDCLIWYWLIDWWIWFDLIWIDLIWLIGWLIDFIWFGLVCFDLIDWKKGWCGWVDWTNKIWSIDELWWFICLWKMVIIHSYVKLPEGNRDWFLS